MNWINLGCIAAGVAVTIAIPKMLTAEQLSGVWKQLEGMFGDLSKYCGKHKRGWDAYAIVTSVQEPAWSKDKREEPVTDAQLFRR